MSRWHYQLILAVTPSRGTHNNCQFWYESSVRHFKLVIKRDFIWLRKNWKFIFLFLLVQVSTHVAIYSQYFYFRLIIGRNGMGWFETVVTWKIWIFIIKNRNIFNLAGFNISSTQTTFLWNLKQMTLSPFCSCSSEQLNIQLKRSLEKLRK